MEKRTDKAVFTVSNGVTTATLSKTPAPIPARTPRPDDSFPFLSAKAALIESKARNLMEAFKAVPTTKEEQPVYIVAMPFSRTVERISLIGFLVSGICVL